MQSVRKAGVILVGKLMRWFFAADPLVFYLEELWIGLYLDLLEGQALFLEPAIYLKIGGLGFNSLYCCRGVTDPVLLDILNCSAQRKAYAMYRKDRDCYIV